MLPKHIQVLERGWLSCNNTLLADGDGVTLVDSGYGDHASQTLALLDHALAGRPLTWLVNTHCHSDHMGGNRAVQEKFGCRTTIPAGEAPLVDAWDEEGLILGFADQRADRFRYDDTLVPGATFRMGDLDWQAVAAPGHDPHALMFYAPAERVLIAGDALWEDGFGVIFPALFGDTHALVQTRAHARRDRAARPAHRDSGPRSGVRPRRAGARARVQPAGGLRARPDAPRAPHCQSHDRVRAAAERPHGDRRTAALLRGRRHPARTSTASSSA